MNKNIPDSEPKDQRNQEERKEVKVPQLKLSEMTHEQLRQVLDEYDNIQHQLEIEVAAHTSCQQELEKIQWDKENFLINQNFESRPESGLIDLKIDNYALICIARNANCISVQFFRRKKSRNVG